MNENTEHVQPLELLKRTNFLRYAKDSSITEIEISTQQVNIKQGQTLLRVDTIETHAFIVIEGSLRLLAKDPVSNDLFTIGTINKGEVVGLVGVLRQAPCEGVIGREECKLLSIPLEIIIKLMKKDEGLTKGLREETSRAETVAVFTKILNKMNPPPENSQNWLREQIEKVNIDKYTAIRKLELLSTELDEYESLTGTVIDEESKKEMERKSKLPLRYIITRNQSNEVIPQDEKDIAQEKEKKVIGKENNYKQQEWKAKEGLNMAEVGIKEARTNIDLQNFKIIKANGQVAANLATLRMLARSYNTTCAVDMLEKVLKGAVERAGSVPIHGVGELIETMGLQTQIGEINISQLNRLELPVLIKTEEHYSLLTEVRKNNLLIANPEKGWVKYTLKGAEEIYGSKMQVILVKRIKETPTKTFGWEWFAPVVKRFKWPLVQVLMASLFIQLFQLANPLLIQQIIDKVINQSNLSALQVLGGALVVSALFQGLLTAVRTWLLIDTTDRMDLILGSQVIDKLLRLPLKFFEARPVGELSQRLSELGNLRGFLTGTAITSLLDILFAIIYIGIMLLYSPTLTLVALSTIPVYILMILVIAPLYRKLIRKQAQYSAKTQSHLIETLSGIQTVKAQHFELTSRWRWQEKYSNQIAEGFKSVVLGSSAGEVGNFLNQLSSLLIIWVGVYQVIKGEISLGQMIAFRIISGYVTGPILRLSSLWQGFQQVSISMERLADIVDQTPETDNRNSNQIALPPIKGDVILENLRFRFRNQGPYQIDSLDVTIDKGSFVGIVGQSGSGKSTLMKLIPRLYEPEEGRILIDGYDISKVSLYSVRQQIGIVPQDCLLFEGTIRENICMNNPEANTETVLKMARAAAAHEFVMELPDGYNTYLGERGAGLSGGQKQRIAIARTLLQNPNMLILDEATSALDYDTEANVCKNLQRILEGKTVFFITHRLSTVKNADLIIMMHQGRIAEQGTHKELINLGGRYAALYAHQDDS